MLELYRFTKKKILYRLLLTHHVSCGFMARCGEEYDKNLLLARQGSTIFSGDEIREIAQLVSAKKIE